MGMRHDMGGLEGGWVAGWVDGWVCMWGHKCGWRGSGLGDLSKGSVDSGTKRSPLLEMDMAHDHAPSPYYVTWA